MKLQSTTVPSPIGTIRLAIRDGALCALGFEEQWHGLIDDLEARLGPLEVDETHDLHDFTGPLAAYFSGNLTAIDSLAVCLEGTAFQREIWSELRRIPAGATASYSELAQRVGRPNAQRAVGAANGSNPVSIVVPCHRVIRSDGSLCGYGGGLYRKKWLLAHERAQR